MANPALVVGKQDVLGALVAENKNYVNKETVISIKYKTPISKKKLGRRRGRRRRRRRRKSRRRRRGRRRRRRTTKTTQRNYST